MASIQKKNNKYCVVYYCKDTEGKRKQKWETYDTKNEAKIRKAEILSLIHISEPTRH